MSTPQLIDRSVLVHTYAPVGHMSLYFILYIYIPMINLYSVSMNNQARVQTEWVSPLIPRHFVHIHAYLPILNYVRTLVFLPRLRLWLYYRHTNQLCAFLKICHNNNMQIQHIRIIQCILRYLIIKIPIGQPEMYHIIFFHNAFSSRKYTTLCRSMWTSLVDT